jgi:hypothetical protein
MGQVRQHFFVVDVTGTGALRTIMRLERLRPIRGSRYLVAERGLAEATIKDYLRTARLFLSRCGLTALATEHVVLDWLDAGKVPGDAR